MQRLHRWWHSVILAGQDDPHESPVIRADSSDDARQGVVRRLPEGREVVGVSTPSQHEPPPADDVITTAELIRRQGVKPFRSVEDLPANDPFGSDEEYEAFLADLYASRREIA
jgi:hypothetical protein